jgi:hypothetical protein
MATCFLPSSLVVAAGALGQKLGRLVITAKLPVWPLILLSALVALTGCWNPHGEEASPCINNLRRIDGATQQWAVEHHKGTNEVPTWDDIRPYLREMTRCPDGGTYTLAPPGARPICSIPEHKVR